LRAYLVVTATGLAQYLLWFALKTDNLPARLFGPGADLRVTLTVLGWGLGLAVLAATLSLGALRLLAPRRRGYGKAGTPDWQLVTGLVLANLMIGGLMLALARAG
jgi:hypothetical protein